MRSFLIQFYTKCVRIISGHQLSRFTIIRGLNNFITNRLKTDTAQIGNNKFHLRVKGDKDPFKLSIFGVYEALETSIFKKNLKEGDVVIDLGANIGYYTLMAAEIVGDKGKVYAFEPDPTNFKVLTKNVKSNKYKNVVLINKAVSDTSKKGKLYLSKTNIGSHQIYDSKEERATLDIELVSLDNYFKDKKIDFMKMDVEGSEGKVFLGAKDLIQSNKNLKILTEFSPNELKDSGIEPERYLDLLLENGFKLQMVDKGKNEIIDIKTKQDVLDSEAIKQAGQVNLFCRKVVVPLENNTK